MSPNITYVLLKYIANRSHGDVFWKKLFQGKSEIPNKNLAAFVSAHEKLWKLCNEQHENENWVVWTADYWDWWVGWNNRNKIWKCIKIVEVIVKGKNPTCLCSKQTGDLVHDVRSLGLEGDQGEEASPVQWSNSSKSEAEDGSSDWTLARPSQASWWMKAGRLFQSGSSCKQMPQTQSVSGPIVLVLTDLQTAVFLNFLGEQRPGQEVELVVNS